MRSWIASFLNGCKNFVQIGDGKSEEWVVESGSGKGRRLSPDLYNIASLSQAILFVALSFFAGYADDGIDIVFGSSDAECDNKLQALAHERKEWYRKAGLPLNISKTEILGFGFSPSPINIDNIIIRPKTEITFLGITIQNDLKWTSQLAVLNNKIRSAAGRIRHDGRHLNTSDKRMLPIYGLDSKPIIFQ